MFWNKFRKYRAVSYSFIIRKLSQCTVGGISKCDQSIFRVLFNFRQGFANWSNSTFAKAVVFLLESEWLAFIEVCVFSVHCTKWFDMNFVSNLLIAKIEFRFCLPNWQKMIVINSFYRDKQQLNFETKTVWFLMLLSLLTTWSYLKIITYLL